MGSGQTTGFVVLWRKMLASAIWDLSPADFKLATTCLLMANWERSDWRGHTIERGAFIASVRTLARDAHLTPKEVRAGLRRLQREAFVKLETSQGKAFTLITVVNYNDYQGVVEGQRRSAGEVDGKSIGSAGEVPEKFGQQVNNLTTNKKQETKSVATRKSPAPPEAVQLARHLLDSIRTHDPDALRELSPHALTSRLNKWADDIRLAMQRDKRTEDELRKAITWCHCDPRGSFWRANIRSGKKLRSQFETLRAQARNSAATARKGGLTPAQVMNLKVD